MTLGPIVDPSLGIDATPDPDPGDHHRPLPDPRRRRCGPARRPRPTPKPTAKPTPRPTARPTTDGPTDSATDRPAHATSDLDHPDAGDRHVPTSPHRLQPVSPAPQLDTSTGDELPRASDGLESPRKPYPRRRVRPHASRSRSPGPGGADPISHTVDVEPLPDTTVIPEAAGILPGPCQVARDRAREGWGVRRPLLRDRHLAPDHDARRRAGRPLGGRAARAACRSS